MDKASMLGNKQKALLRAVSSPLKNVPEKQQKPENLAEKLQACLFSSFQ